MIPIRAGLAITVTIIGLFLLVNFKTPDVAPRTAQLSPVIPATPAGAAQSPAPVANGATPVPTPAPTPYPSGLRNGTYTGQDVPNEFGDVQVAVVIKQGRIASLQDVQMPYDRPRSAYISDQAGPILQQEVLQAQSAQIDLLGGATFTSESYAESVQSALDQAKAK